MLLGRLGLEKARIPHADRHGLVWLDRGRLEVEDGCLRFVTVGGGSLKAGDYQIPHQSISIVLLGPGSSVTHVAPGEGLEGRMICSETFHSIPAGSTPARQRRSSPAGTESCMVHGNAGREA